MNYLQTFYFSLSFSSPVSAGCVSTSGPPASSECQCICHLGCRTTHWSHLSFLTDLHNNKPEIRPVPAETAWACPQTWGSWNKTASPQERSCDQTSASSIQSISNFHSSNAKSLSHKNIQMQNMWTWKQGLCDSIMASTTLFAWCMLHYNVLPQKQDGLSVQRGCKMSQTNPDKLPYLGMPHRTQPTFQALLRCTPLDS